MIRRLLCGLTALVIVMAPTATADEATVALCPIELPEPIKNQWQCPSE